MLDCICIAGEDHMTGDASKLSSDAVRMRVSRSNINLWSGPSGSGGIADYSWKCLEVISPYDDTCCVGGTSVMWSIDAGAPPGKMKPLT